MIIQQTGDWGEQERYLALHSGPGDVPQQGAALDVMQTGVNGKPSY